MTDQAPSSPAPAPRPARTPVRRTPLRHTVVRLAATAGAAATLVWSGLFYSAVSKHYAATPAANVPAQSGGSSSTAAAKSLPPVTTRTS